MGGPNVFLVADLIAAGRIANGEFLAFDRFQSSTEIVLDKRLYLRERVDCGADRKRWIWSIKGEPAGFLATVYIQFPSAASVVEAVFACPSFKQAPGTLCGITALSTDFLTLRIAGNSNRGVTALLKALLGQISDYLPVSDVYRRVG